MEKYRSLDLPYKRWILKEYKYWTLVLHDDQRYLGRAYVWLLREGEMQRFSELEDAESTELKFISREYERVLEELWKPDFMNYAWLANLFNLHSGHGHLHLIPRYKDERTFADTIFVDGRWGENYTPHEEFKPSEDIMLHICDILRNKLGS